MSVHKILQIAILYTFCHTLLEQLFCRLNKLAYVYEVENLKQFFVTQLECTCIRFVTGVY